MGGMRTLIALMLIAACCQAIATVCQAGELALQSRLFDTIGNADSRITTDGGSLETGKNLRSRGDVVATENGYIVDLHLDGPDPITPTFFFSIISPESWIEVDFRRGFRSGAISAVTDGFFNPYGGRTQDQLIGLHLLAPSQRPYGGSLVQRDRCFHTPDWDLCSESGSIHFEMIVREIDPPLPGDANLDGMVAFDDFLRLANNFSPTRWSKERPGWFNGDFTLNGYVEFDDFQILAANYGAVRETAAVAVPEPASALLVGLALGAFRRPVRSS